MRARLRSPRRRGGRVRGALTSAPIAAVGLIVVIVAIPSIPDQLGKWLPWLKWIPTAVTWFQHTQWGLALIGVALIVWAIVRAFPQQAVPASSPPEAQADTRPLAPTGGAPATPAVATVPTEEPRVFTARTVEQLTGEFQNATWLQGAERVKGDLGKWMRISGPLGNVVPMGTGLTVTFADRTIFSYNVVRMHFEHKASLERLRLRNQNDPLTVVGRIESVDVQTVSLDRCELEEQAPWPPNIQRPGSLG
jgi:hypothetical protein